MSTAEHRRRVRMSPEEAQAMLETAKNLQFSTVDADGAPHLATLWYGLIDGQIVGWTPKDSRKGRNLLRDQRVACLVEAGDVYSEIRGVSLRGRVELVLDPEGLTRIAHAIFERNFPPDQRPDVSALVAGGRRVGFIVRADEIASWDHRKLEGSGPRP